MRLGNFAYELADLRAEQERETGIRRASAAVSRPGQRWCIDCTEEIDEARRKAAPFARRCITCAQILERSGRKRG